MAIKYSSESSTDHRQRLRGKFQEKGIEALADIEVVELLLTFAPPRSDCKQAARDALAKFGSLPEVLDASPVLLKKKVKGMGPKNIFALQFVQGIARRYLRQRIQKKNYITSSKDVADYLIHALRFHSDKAM
ncbi:DNA repair protein RadC [Candidatus Electrothrix marina]|uniref:DNA repair protein RadC n=1 Tax=Candidatus Electrothrix marina TaxID=1859130 RepID=A0A444JBX8_9BACT|nr:DNA repair protein RadC [Candidatus Electrothrix marina]